jgi:hypothetical protein
MNQMLPRDTTGTPATVSGARELAAKAWHQFLASAVSDGAEPHDVFAWAYMAGWAHDKWPAVVDIVPPPDLASGS